MGYCLCLVACLALRCHHDSFILYFVLAEVSLSLKYVELEVSHHYYERRDIGLQILPQVHLQLTQMMSISLSEASKAMTSFSGIFQAVERHSQHSVCQLLTHRNCDTVK